MKINRVIKTLITADFLFNGGFSLFAPIFAIYVTKQIDGGSLQVIGFAAAIVQICKSVVQIPVARILDKNHGEYDDFYSMIFGSFLFSLVPFLYIFARTATHIYIIQAVYGISLAFAVPPWYAIFTRHIDKMQENIEWSLDSVTIGISGASAAALGGYLASRVGFPTIFVLAGILTAMGAAMQVKIFSDLKAKVSQGQVKPSPEKVL